jgi:hypothetical protein
MANYLVFNKNTSAEFMVGVDPMASVTYRDLGSNFFVECFFVNDSFILGTTTNEAQQITLYNAILAALQSKPGIGLVEVSLDFLIPAVN